ncbi:MAG: fasciclin domain-containing protein [Phycisphaerales bacterium]
MNVLFGRIAVAGLLGVGFTGNFAFGQCSSGKAAEAASMSAVAMVGDADIVDTAVAAGSFKTLVAAVQAAGLAEALKGPGPFTVFAPTDEAFAKLPKGTVETLLKPENKAQLASILKYHVVSGSAMAADVTKMPAWTTLEGQRINITAKNGKAMVDNATITKTDIACKNGVIHVIDTVIMPSSDNIVATADKAGSFSTLIAACKAADLAGVLSGPGPFTVFAPTDEAFAKLPPGTLDMLLKPENKDTLASILKYHVVSGRVFSPDAVKAGKAPTVQGDSITITSTAKGVMINNANVVTADIDASNGVIHVIDAVILPKAVAESLKNKK